MKALDRKLQRDLRRTAAQVAAIALVVASGVALFIATMTTYRSLRLSEAHYYRAERFADVWASVSRAPLAKVRDIRNLPGVVAVEARIVTPAILDVPGLSEPASALLVSTTPGSGPALNGLYIRSGRQLETGRPREVLVSEAFASKSQLGPGDSLVAVTSGRRIKLTIVGVALSPEHVMQVPPNGQSPDDRRFAVLWMNRAELERVADLKDSFNDVALGLGPGANERELIERLDRLLAPFGGRGAYGRLSQASHVMLEDHIEQLKSLAMIAEPKLE